MWANDPAGPWTNATSVPVYNSWYDIAYGDGTFVAVSGFGGNSVRAIRSTDGGKTWSAPTGGANTNQNYDSVAYGNNMFVAVSSTAGSSGIIYSSNGGVNWYQAANTPNGGWQSIAFGGGTWVVVGNSPTGNNYGYSSQGSSSWTFKTYNAGTYWSSVTYGNGIFSAVSLGNNNAMYSTSGTSWSSASLPNSANWSSVCAGGVEAGFDYLAFSYNPNQIAVSKNSGATWDLIDYTPASAMYCSWGAGKFVAVGPSTQKPIIWSNNGTSWSGDNANVYVAKQQCF